MQKIDETDKHEALIQRGADLLIAHGFTQRGESLEFRRELGGELDFQMLVNVCNAVECLGYDAEFILPCGAFGDPEFGATEAIGDCLAGVQFRAKLRD